MARPAVFVYSLFGFANRFYATSLVFRRDGERLAVRTGAVFLHPLLGASGVDAGLEIRGQVCVEITFRAGPINIDLLLRITRRLNTAFEVRRRDHVGLALLAGPVLVDDFTTRTGGLGATLFVF